MKQWMLVMILLTIARPVWGADDDEPRAADKLIKLGKKVRVSSLAVNGDGTRAYVHLNETKGDGKFEDRLVEMDLATGKVIRVIAEGLLEREVGLERMLPCPDGKSVILFLDRGKGFGEKRSMLRQIRLEDGRIVREVEVAEQSGCGTRPAFSLDGTTLYCFAGDAARPRIAAIDLESGRETSSLPLPRQARNNDRRGVSLFACRTSVLVFDESEQQGLLTSWDPATGKASAPVGLGIGYRTACGIEPPPITASADQIFFINEENPEEIAVREVNNAAKKSSMKSSGAVRIHVTGKLLLASTREGVSVYHLEKQKWVGALETGAFGSGYYKLVTWLNVSADGRTLVAAEEETDEAGQVDRERDRLTVFDLGRYLKK